MNGEGAVFFLFYFPHFIFKFFLSFYCYFVLFLTAINLFYGCACEKRLLLVFEGVLVFKFERRLGLYTL
jgi:hypothetical protein